MSKAKVISRTTVVALALSAAYYSNKVKEEGFTRTPTIPVAGDRPTIGYGSTFYEDGSPVKMADPAITRDRAWRIVDAHNRREQSEFTQTLSSVTLYQQEFELFFDWRYQYGLGAWKTSGILSNLKAGKRVQACNVILQYKFMKSAALPTNPTGWEVSKRDKQGRPTEWRYDCSTPGNKVCRGVHERNVRRHTECMKYAMLDELPAPTQEQAP